MHSLSFSSRQAVPRAKATPFGCRLLATMNLDPAEKRQALVSARRSLKEQSHTPNSRAGDVLQDDYFHPVARSITHTDGFGALLMENKLHHQTRFSILQCAQVPALLRHFQDKMSGLFHVRFATVGDVSNPNSHPYHYQGLSLIQNGSLDSSMMDGYLYSDHVKNTIKQALPDVHLRDKDSDSRRLFFYWLATLKQAHPKQSLDTLPTETILNSFKGVQNEVMATRPLSLIPLKPDKELPVSGQLDFTNKINSILSVGDNRIIGLKHGRELHLGYKLNNKGQITGAMLATEPPQLKSRFAIVNALFNRLGGRTAASSNGFHWVSLPDKHWIILTKQSRNLVKAELRPY